jgi:hypothetical protein
MKKTCKECLQEKPLSEFYKYSTGSRCAFSKCKECTKKAVRENRANKKDYYIKYDRMRQQTRERKNKKADYLIKHRAKHPEKNKARARVCRALREGKLTKEPCEICGCIKAEAHHDDYSKPLSVRWLCDKHHKEFHKQNSVPLR